MIKDPVVLTWTGEVIWVVCEELGPSDISKGTEEHDGPHETGVKQGHALVRGELGHGVTEHHVLPVVLHTTHGYRTYIVHLLPTVTNWSAVIATFTML